MASSSTLFQKLQAHFNSAAEQYPRAKELFDSQLEKCRKSLVEDAPEKNPHDLFSYKGICYQVTQIEESFEEGEKMVRVFWDAEKLIKEHKGPKF